jgi:hypothetical protein
MITYSWTCACGITIQTSSEKQMATAKNRHYRIHANESGWSVEQ